MCLYNWFSTISGFAAVFNFITILIPSLSDSSLKSEIPVIFLSLTNSAIFINRFDLFTWYGISVTMIVLRLPVSSMWLFALNFIFPFLLSMHF